MNWADLFLYNARYKKFVVDKGQYNKMDTLKNFVPEYGNILVGNKEKKDINLDFLIGGDLGLTIASTSTLKIYCYDDENNLIAQGSGNTSGSTMWFKVKPMRRYKIQLSNESQGLDGSIITEMKIIGRIIDNADRYIL